MEIWSAVDKSVTKSTPQLPRPVSEREGWRNLRVFVSSTFTDFYSERELLNKEVDCGNYGLNM